MRKSFVESLETRRLLALAATQEVVLESTTGTAENPVYNYKVVLTNTGTVAIGTFWFAWIPGANYLATRPSAVSNPAGWSNSLIGAGNQTDGTSIEWISDANSKVMPGNSLDAFKFSTADSPNDLAGLSPQHPTSTVKTSYIYGGGPFSDSGFTIKNGISGRVFNDSNSNGVMDGAECGVASWNLYLDTNNNNTKDAGEPSTTTNASGVYTFGGAIVDGTYRVKQQIQSGFRKTLPGTGIAGYDAALTGSQTAGKDFGVTSNILLGGTCFNDMNSNGIQDAGEAPFAGITVDISSNGSTVASRTTDANGKWQVKGLSAGSGEASIISPPGYFAKVPMNGKYTGSMTAGQQNANLNFGMGFVGAAPADFASTILNKRYNALEYFDESA
jgi:hypothetical protein